MKVSMSVTLDKDGEESVTRISADARDVRKYEGEFKASFLTTELSMVQLTQLAYVTMLRLGAFTGSYDTFDAQCVEVEGVDEEPVPDPTGPDPGAAS
jgi:hypothetical protein